MQTKVVNTMDYKEFDALVEKHFPLIEFNIVAEKELPNDSVCDLGLSTKVSFDERDDIDKDLIYDAIVGARHNFGWNSPEIFLDFFVKMGILPEGNYQIDISW